MTKINISFSLIQTPEKASRVETLDMCLENLCFTSVTCRLCDAHVATVFPVSQFPSNSTIKGKMLQSQQIALIMNTGAGWLSRSAGSATICSKERIL